MDEVITCRCGCQSWVIGNAGIRCPKCNYYLPPGKYVEVLESIYTINRQIQVKEDGRGMVNDKE
jgi:hypothetical protein